jgi:secreted PhoX family phosphatase
MPGAPAWREDASQDAAAQAKQFGEHNDGMHYFPFPTRGGGAAGLSSERGLLCVNHEYTHEEILHGAAGLGGAAGVTIAKARKSQAAHGVSVNEVRKLAGKWGLHKGSPYGRRITANTPMRISGPAAGHALMQSKKFDITPAGSIEIGVNDGFTACGTANNCAHGYTPWGTYLTCEENWNGYFGWLATDSAPTDATLLNGQVRYGLRTASTTTGTSSIHASTRAPTRWRRTISAGWWRSIPSIPRASR